MNFAPYQSSPPESTRALSPPPRSPNASPTPRNKSGNYFPSIADQSDPWAASRPARLPSPSTFADQPSTTAGGYQDIESGQGLLPPQQQDRVLGDVFETSLGMRMDWEACLAYLLLPPAGGAVLLLFEHKSDYVRFHAWQSALVFAALFVLHLILSWSTVLSWLLFAVDLGLIAYLTFHAYRDAETLDRLELPFFGRLASNFVDSE
ncbi:hypothetical protein K461DRAFT_292423 [Myriangium duriaei CBS 260.36]|uniref:Uncharacterized protein n=1 Tax=Myriangium duriaei CBS 260.36 TaxID=1168546 RepID=A0A9P4J221_9PEZI|nr:hypothetical protein K461DRAFT_292423 [Myriangium duriaei CBS 260.36]